MRKVVINTSYERFCLSHKAIVRLRELGQPAALAEPDRGTYWPLAAKPTEPSLNQYGESIPRDDAHLIRVVEELGAEANGHCAALKVISIPEDVAWTIERIDAGEQISEVRRIWR